MYYVRPNLSDRYELDRSAAAIKLRSRKSARAEELVRWAAAEEESRRAGREPRSPSPRGGARDVPGTFVPLDANS